MHKGEPQQPLNPGSQIHLSQISNVSQKKQKENQSKHMNAIKPYVVGAVKQRKISKRDSQKNIPTLAPYVSAHNQTESKSRGRREPQHQSFKKAEQTMGVPNRNVSELYTELINIKSEYKLLKNSYNGLVKNNNDLTERGEREAAELRREIGKLRREEEQHRNNIQFMEQQIERIKKECVRMIETEKFKNKKLEETIQEKQLMIAYLRSQLAVLNGETTSPAPGFYFQHTAPSFSRAYGGQPEANPNGDTSTFGGVAEAEEQRSMPKSLTSFPSVLPYSVPVHPQNNRSMVNQSAISSIPNSSLISVADIVDLPRQINTKRPPFAKPEVPDKKPIQGKRQYLFASEEDSLSFSYEKSKESIVEQESISSSDPHMLTFTKKDLYVLDEEESEPPQTNKENKMGNNILIVNNDPQLKSAGVRNRVSSVRNTRDQPQHPDILKKGHDLYSENQEEASIETNMNHCLREQIPGGYTGEEQIMTFENREGRGKQVGNQFDMEHFEFAQHQKFYNEHISSSKGPKNKPKNTRSKNTSLVNCTQDEESRGNKKSRQNTKRLQIMVDDNIIAQVKESSVQTKKRPTNHPQAHKKKLSRKRKSEENGSLPKK